MIKKISKEVLEKIVGDNATNSIDSIPPSDLFAKKVMSNIGIQADQLKQILSLLKESHYIFIFEIVKEDRNHEVKKIEGYVETNLETITRLKNFFQHVLMSEYEKQFNKKLFVGQIIKEIYQSGQSFQNTPLGQIANKAIMLQEFEGLVEKHYDQYSESWKTDKFDQLSEQYASIFETKKSKELEQEIEKSEGKDNDKNVSQNRRAIDSEEYSKLSRIDNKQSLNKVLSIYGVEFFFRVNLRNCNYEIIQYAIENGNIDRKSNLKLLKEMIHKVKSNIKKDPKLKDHTDDDTKSFGFKRYCAGRACNDGAFPGQ